MKTVKRTRQLLALLACAFLGLANASGATALTIYVDPTTWVYAGFATDPGGQLKLTNYLVLAPLPPYYITYKTNYYFGGFFDTVYVESSVDGSTLQTLSANNVCYITGHQAYNLSQNYNGSGNGVSGLVRYAKAFNNGDIYLGGDFTAAGGYSSSSYFACYKFSGGWSGGGVYVDERVTYMDLSNYDLLVEGSFIHIYGPTNVDGPYVTVSTANGKAKWREAHNDFFHCYWDTNGF